MNFKPTYHSYRSTGSFSNLVLDYLDDVPALKEFYSFRPDLEGIKKSIESKSKDSINRNLLVKELKNQYHGIDTSEKVDANIELLLKENCFTICTAHQPNIFTGHLYFIYKIIHAIKLADELNTLITDKHFVPVYYMGSEDADLNELGQVVVNGVVHKWETSQKGAVGRMTIDDSFLKLIEAIERQLIHEPHGAEIISILKKCYSRGKTIAGATFELVNFLFGEFGLIILLPDNTAFKGAFKQVIKKELLENHSSASVEKTIAAFPKQYKIQTEGRPINLFFLKEDIRARIELHQKTYKVVNTKIQFTTEEILEEVDRFPERFSPNVILRPLYQEMILPNVAFVGGGGELAYWLELKKIFDANHLSFPVLMLRNSFTLVNSKISESIALLGLSIEDFFESVYSIQNKYVKAISKHKTELNEEKSALKEVYDNIKKSATGSDPTLYKHVEALSTKALSYIEALEKKMLRAEKKKNETSVRKIEKIKNELYPYGVLQERVENMLQFYARYGSAMIKGIYDGSLAWGKNFTVIDVTSDQ